MLAIAAGCSQDTGAALPSFLQRLTADIESGPVTESPGAIWRYRYRDQFVYYVPPLPCCDFASTLYDAGGATGIESRSLGAAEYRRLRAVGKRERRRGFRGPGEHARCGMNRPG